MSEVRVLAPVHGEFLIRRPRVFETDLDNVTATKNISNLLEWSGPSR